MIFETKENAAGNHLDRRSLKTGAVTLLIATVYLLAMQKTAWAAGFAIGSALSLFSTFSLQSAVHMLFKPTSGPFNGIILILMMFIKLPMYCMVLDFALTARNISHGAVVIGLGLLPAVITLKTIAQHLIQNDPAAAQVEMETETPAKAARFASKFRRAVRVAHERG